MRRKRMPRRLRTVAVALALVGTPLVVVSSVSESRSFALSNLQQAKDENRDPRVVEVQLEAKEADVELVPGTVTKMWTYNGTVPGPMILANLGDQVIVHIRNRLPEPTTIHWHGVEVPADMDGSNVSQVPIAPGESFTYRFRTLAAATYWYHPHHDGAQQVERGLYGALVVRNPERDAKLGLPEDEKMLMVDDILLDDKGQLSGFATDPSSDLPPRTRAIQLADGREGNHLIVNGRELPTLEVTAGKPQRWRIVNVANGRFMRLSVPGQTMYRIAGDGGLITHPQKMRNVSMFPDPADAKRRISEPDPETGLVLVPGERAEVVITPRGAPGDEITVEAHDLPRGRHDVLTEDNGNLAYGHNFDDGKADPKPVMRLRVTATAGETYRPYVPPDPLTAVPRLDVTDVPTVDIPFGHEEPQPNGMATFFSAQRGDTPIPFDKLTPDDAPDVEVDKTYVLQITNTTKMDHPVHVHGFFFQPLETEFVDPANPANNQVIPFLGRENKDTIRIPAAPGAHEGAGGKTILRLAIRFDDRGRNGKVEAFGKTPTKGRSGGWMVHCHNQEHADAGMMTILELREPRSAKSARNR